MAYRTVHFCVAAIFVAAQFTTNLVLNVPQLGQIAPPFGQIGQMPIPFVQQGQGSVLLPSTGRYQEQPRQSQDLTQQKWVNPFKSVQGHPQPVQQQVQPVQGYPQQMVQQQPVQQFQPVQGYPQQMVQQQPVKQFQPVPGYPQPAQRQFQPAQQEGGYSFAASKPSSGGFSSIDIEEKIIRPSSTELPSKKGITFANTDGTLRP